MIIDRNARGVILAGSGVTLFLTGFSFSVWGVFVPPLIAEFRESAANVALPFSISMLTWGVTQPLTGTVADRKGTRAVILFGLIMMALGWLIMGVSQELWQVALGFGIFIGTAQSAAGSITYALLISKWFGSGSRGSAVGLIQGALPASPLLMVPILYYFIVAFSWRTAALASFALLVFITLPLALIFVHEPPASAKSADDTSRKSQGMSVIEVFQLPALRNLFIARIACGLGFLVIPHLAEFATESGLTANDSATALTLYGGAGAVGAVLGGMAADRWGRIPSLVGTYMLRGLGCVALALIFEIHSVISGPAYTVLFFLLVALATGPIYATVGVNNVQVFEIVGPKRAGFVLGLSLVLHQIAAAIGPYAAGLAHDLSIPYRFSILGLGLVLLLAMLPASRAGIQKAGPPRTAPVGKPAEAL